MSFARPDADSAIGNWTNEAASTVSIFASIDESAASNTDYAASGDLLTSSPDIYKVRLSDPASASLPATVRYRYYKSVSGSQKVNLGVRLLQGVSAVSSWSHNDISASVSTAEQSVVAGITDFNDLYLEFTADLNHVGEPLGILMSITRAS